MDKDDLLELNLLADNKRDRFGARVSLECGGVAVELFPTNRAVFSAVYAKALGKALIRGAQILEAKLPC